MSEEILVERRADAVWLTIASPPRNLLTPDNMTELTARLDEADKDEAVRAIVLNGAGDTFCAGLDTSGLAAGEDPGELGKAFVTLLELAPRLGTPLLGAINGDALAAGFALALVTDWSVAVDGARLGTIEASFGRWPMIAQVATFRRLLPRHALANILTGEPFSAQRAMDVGAINAVVASARLVQEIDVLIPRLTAASPAALAAGRRAFYRLAEKCYDDALEGSLSEFVTSFSK